MQLIMYIPLRFPTLSFTIVIYVAQDVLYSYLCYSLTPQNLKSLVHRMSHYGKCNFFYLVVIIFSYFLHISIRLFVNFP